MDSRFIDHANLNPSMIPGMVAILTECGLFDSHISFTINYASYISEINFSQYPILRSVV
jgi:hypothetical protein